MKSNNSPLILAALLFALGCSRNSGTKKPDASLYQSNYYNWMDINVDSIEQLLATKTFTDVELMRIHKDLSNGYQETNFEKSVFHARQGILYADKVNAQITKGNLYRNIGVLYYTIDQFDTAMIYFNKALDQVKLIEKKSIKDADNLAAQVYGGIGNLYNMQGNYPETLKYYMMMLKILEKYDSLDKDLLPLYNNIAEIYITLENYEEAEKYSLKMTALAKKLNNTEFIISGLLRESHVNLHNQDYPQALKNATAAYQMGKPFFEKSFGFATRILAQLSDVYLVGYQDYANAEKYALLSLQYAEKSENKNLISNSLGDLANVYLLRGSYSESDRTALRAFETDSTDLENNKRLFLILTYANIHMSHTQKILDYFARFNSIRDEQSNKNFQSSLVEMQTKYETEKKQLEIDRQQAIIKSQNLQRGLLAAGVIVSVAILFLLWYMLRLRNRRNRALEETNATKDRFFSIISHDLKNPAIAQRDALQMLLDHEGMWNTETLNRYYRELLKSADGQVNLLYNLLNWAQVQTGRMPYRPAPFDLAAELRKTDISLLQNMANRKGVTLAVEMPDAVLVTGDADMLVTVVRNLLTNAVKFTPAGGTVTLEVKSFGEPSSFSISIADTGTGITAEQIQNLFRLDSAHSQRGTADEQGSGLGLIVCKELLEKHGSELHVESEEGKGSRFWFELV